MKNKIPQVRRQDALLFACTCWLFTTCFSFFAEAQTHRAVDGEMATCKVTVSNKIYNPQLNQLGCFDRVANIPLQATTAVEVYYPDGNEGEKVVVSAMDGGTLDNGKTVKVVQLDNQKKLSFSFRFTADDPGIYRILLHKGDDFKTVQLWAGPELPVAKK